MPLKYKRILLKLSGEALMSPTSASLEAFDPVIIAQFANEIKSVIELGVQVAIVVGGGNIYRGMNEAESGIERAHGDYMGMLATVINGMALQAMLEKLAFIQDCKALLNGTGCGALHQAKSNEAFGKNRVVIFGGGTGNPYFTTDTAGSLRAIEMKAEVILKGTRVDGIYSADPEKDPNATRFDTISFKECIDKNLKIMDTTAFVLCMENKLPIIVFDMNKPGNLAKLVQGEQVGTLVQ